MWPAWSFMTAYEGKEVNVHEGKEMNVHEELILLKTKYNIVM